MRRTLHILLFAIIMTSSNTWAQYYVTTIEGTESLTRDSVRLTIGELKGIPSWQVSSDSINWIELDEQGDSLLIGIDSAFAFRAKIAYGNCDPIYSDTGYVGINLVIPESNTFKLDQKGQVYQLPIGIKLIVYPNAVEKETTISVEMLDSISASGLLPFPMSDLMIYLNTVNFISEIKQLSRPIKIRIPVDLYRDRSLPLVYLYDDSDQVWNKYLGEMICSPIEGYIELTVDRICPIRIHARPGFFNLTSIGNLKSSSDSELHVTKSSTEANNNGDQPKKDADCIFKVVFEDSDINSIKKGQICSVNLNKGSIKFLDCEHLPSSKWMDMDIGSDCQPNLVVKVNGGNEKEFVKVGEIVSLTFYASLPLELEKFPLAKQEIEITLPDGFGVDEQRKTTDKQGIVTFYVEALEENLGGIIDYTANFNYCLQRVEINEQGTEPVSECLQNLANPIILTGSIKLIAWDDCTDPAKIDCSNSKDPECFEIKEFLERTSISILPEYQLMDFNDELSLTLTTNNGSPFDRTIQSIQWESSDPSIAAVNEGIVSTQAIEGQVEITATLCELEDTAIIEVKNETCDSAKVSISPNELSIRKGGSFQIDIIFGASADYQTYIPLLNFKSENDGIADVNSDGEIRGIEKGHTTISVSWCDTTVTIEVEVVDFDYCDSADVEVNTNTIHLNTGGDYRIKIMNYPTTSGNLYVPKVTFESNNSDVATVNNSGIVNAISEGETKIVVAWCDETIEVPVSVKDNYVYYHVTVEYKYQTGYNESSSTGFDIWDHYTIVQGEYVIKTDDRFYEEVLRNSSHYSVSSFSHYKYTCACDVCGGFLSYSESKNQRTTHSDSVPIILIISTSSPTASLDFLAARHVTTTSVGFRAGDWCDPESGDFNHPFDNNWYSDSERIPDLNYVNFLQLYSSDGGKVWSGEERIIQHWQKFPNTAVYSAQIVRLKSYQKE